MKGQSGLEDWQLYERGIRYYGELGLYDTVNVNESFFAGDQWRDEWGGKIDTGGLPAPVFNLFKRVIHFQIATILSSKVSLNFRGLPASRGGKERQVAEEAGRRLTAFAADKWEKMDMDQMLGDALLDAALQGNGVFFTYWDGSEQGEGRYRGDFVTRTIDNVNFFPADPTDPDLDRQPYLLISGRSLVESVRQEARENGAKEQDLRLIYADDQTKAQAGRLSADEPPDSKCTVLTKLWRNRETGTIWFRRSVKNLVIVPDTDLRLSRYPVAQFAWDKRKGSWIGQAVATGLVPNQRYINQSFAMVMYHMMMTAFSKIVYNADKVEGGWDNSVGSAIPVTGDVDGVAKVIEGGQMQSGMLDTIDKAMRYTKELMGATEVALGETEANNTSAILTMQRASNISLDLVKRNLYGCVERLGLIWLDFMTAYYPDDRLIPCGAGEWRPFEGSTFRDDLLSCRVEAGPADYFSNLNAVAALDKLLENGHLDFTQYLERMPDGVIPGKEELLATLRSKAVGKEEEQNGRDEG